MLLDCWGTRAKSEKAAQATLAAIAIRVGTQHRST